MTNDGVGRFRKHMTDVGDMLNHFTDEHGASNMQLYTLAFTRLENGQIAGGSVFGDADLFDALDALTKELGFVSEELRRSYIERLMRAEAVGEI